MNLQAEDLAGHLAVHLGEPQTAINGEKTGQHESLQATWIQESAQLVGDLKRRREWSGSIRIAHLLDPLREVGVDLARA